MSDVLTGPFAAAAIVVCVAGVAKLRSPAPAAHALGALGLPARSWMLRVVAVLEVALAVWCLSEPRPVAAGVLACAYAVFAAVAVLLLRQRASCGCFGESDVPTSAMHCALSVALVLLCAAAAHWTPHGFSWVLDRQPSIAAALVIGIGGCAYAMVLAYTELPAAWAAWSQR